MPRGNGKGADDAAKNLQGPGEEVKRPATLPPWANLLPFHVLGRIGRLPRVKSSTKGEGHERRYFYGSVWAVCFAQPALWLMWYVVPRGRAGDAVKLILFVGILAFVGRLARDGKLPRTRPIVPGEIAVSD